MASVSMATPLAAANRLQPPSSATFFKPLQVRESKPAKVAGSKARLGVEASLKEKAVAGMTAAAMVVPEVAQAAGGVTPSLKNFLLSIVAGGVVLAVLVGAVIGVANFDPVKRN